MPKPAPHFVADYQRMVGKMLRGGDRDEAMSAAVGGNYESGGERERGLLVSVGLRAGDYLIDAGCGSGRLASALHQTGPVVRYLGTDVVPELLAYAREQAPNPGWRFELVDGLTIPEADGSADFVAFFSVLTHLSEAEGDAYLRDAKRVLKPGGKIVVSFLDPADMPLSFRLETHAAQFLRRIIKHTHKTVFTRRAVMERRAREMNMRATFIGQEPVGQHVCVFQSVM